MSEPVLDPTERSSGELEDHFVEVSGHETFETACRNVAKNTPSEERTALVVTRREFRISTEGNLRQIPPRSYLVGEADFSENHPEAWTLRDAWSDGVAPLVDDPNDPLPAVGGEFFGRDNSVFLLPYLTIPNPDSDRPDTSPV